MVRLVLFDIDGTLIQSGGAGEKAFARVCATEFGRPQGAARLHFAGRTDRSIVRDFFRQFDIEASEENFRRFFDSYVFWLDHLLDQISGRVLPGAHELIRALRAWPRPPILGLLTGNILLGAHLKLSRYQLWHHFQTGGFADDHEDRNQIAAIVRDRGNRLLNKKLVGDEIVVIGDTPRDIECAKFIQAKSLAVATGVYPLNQLAEQTPTWAVESLEELSLEEICR